MPTIPERLAEYEARLNAVVERLVKLEDGQETIKNNLVSSQLDMQSIMDSLRQVVKEMAAHNELHKQEAEEKARKAEKDGEKRFNWFNVAMACFMAIIAMLELVNAQKKPEVRYLPVPNQISQTSKE